MRQSNSSILVSTPSEAAIQNKAVSIFKSKEITITKKQKQNTLLEKALYIDKDIHKECTLKKKKKKKRVCENRQTAKTD